MATEQSRVNVTFAQPTVRLLSSLARRKHQSLARVVRELTLEALDLHEDVHLSKLAAQLDKKGAKTYDHDAAWE